MLTKELLAVEKRRPNVRPRYRDVEEHRPLAERVIEAYEPGRTRGEVEDAVGEMETHDTFKLVRGLSKLLERRATFEERSPAPPDALRDAVFERGPVTDDAARRRVLEAVADDFELTPAAVEDHLWADREDNLVLAEAPAVDPAVLLRQYNLSLTQTLLFDAVELRFAVSDNYQEIFGLISYLGLMYTVDEDLTVTVTGPAALFERTRSYGTTLAKLVPSIVKAEEWRLSADVETEVGDETRLYEFAVDDDETHRFPASAAVESFDSEVERDFAARIDALAEGWTVTREPTILRTGPRVMIPDFGFERDGEELYLEVVGFWTPEYLAEKVEKVRHLESAHPVMLAVDASLNCTEADFENEAVDLVFFYEDRIPVKPVLDRLRAIDERRIESDLERLTDRAPPVSDDEATDLAAFAREHGVDPSAAEAYLTDRCEGVVSGGTFLPPSVLDDLEAALDGLESDSLADVNEVLDDYGVAQGVLEDVGYAVRYVSLDQSEARVSKVEEG